MKKLKKILISTPALLFYFCIVAYAAQQTIVSTDTLNQAWTKQNSNNTEIYSDIVALRTALNDAGIPLPDELVFTTTGQTFNPLLLVTGTPDILWQFADGSTSTLASPTIDYGSAATRFNRLTVTPWSAVTSINIGYGQDDGGSPTIPIHPQQNVIDVQNLNLVSAGLEIWASSRNAIPLLDFDNFSALHTIESYDSPALVGVTFNNTPALARLCIELCRVNDPVDFSTSPGLADVRGALNQNYTSPIFGSVGANLWHLCIRDNPQFVVDIPEGQFPIMQDLYLWSTNQSGPFTPVVTELLDVQVYNNAYTSANLANATNMHTLNIYNNALTTLDVANPASLTIINAQNNNLPEAQIDAILAALDGAGLSNGTANLTTNSPPSAAGLVSVSNLQGRGWTVSHESGTAVALLNAPTPVFGTTPTPLEVDVVVTNNGDIATTPQTPTFATGTRFSVTNNGCTASLNPAASCNIGVTFDADASCTGGCADTMTVPYEQTPGGTVLDLDVALSATTGTPVAEITFTTSLASVTPYIETTGGPTILWTFEDGGTSALESPTINFGSAGLRSHTLTVTPATGLTRFGHATGAANQGMDNVAGLNNYPALSYVYFYTTSCPNSLTTLDIAGCAAITDFHMAHVSASAATVDQWLIDLDAAVVGPMTGQLFIPTNRTAASDAAYTSLDSKGFTMAEIDVPCTVP